MLHDVTSYNIAQKLRNMACYKCYVILCNIMLLDFGEDSI